jgi:hypothetical protein
MFLNAFKLLKPVLDQQQQLNCTAGFVVLPTLFTLLGQLVGLWYRESRKPRKHTQKRYVM